MTPKMLIANSMDKPFPLFSAFINSECQTAADSKVSFPHPPEVPNTLKKNPLTNRTRINPIPQPRDNPPHNHLRNPKRTSLQRRPDRKNNASKPDTLLPSQPLAKKETEERAEEAADFVDRDDGALQGGRAGAAGGGVDGGELGSGGAAG